MKNLAQKYNADKMICRRCYARLDCRAKSVENVSLQI